MSIFDISVGTANLIYNIAYGALIAGAVLTVAGLLTLFLAEGVRNKDHETKILKLRNDNLVLQTNFDKEQIERLKLEGKTEGFRLDIAKANQAVAEAKERTASLESDNVQARLERERLVASNLELTVTLERERDARVRIEAGLSSRHVSTQQRNELVNALRGSNLTVFVTRYSDAEAKAYANEIISALDAAGIKTIEGPIIMATSGHAQGLFIEETASKVIDAFRSAGFRIETRPSTQFDKFRTGEGLNILVGLKPTAF